MSSSTRSKRFLKAGLVTLLSLSAGVVLAAKSSGPGDIGQVAENVFGTLPAIAKLLIYGAYIAGVGFAVTAMLQFKAHKDNPTQVPLGKPIAFLFIAGGLMFIPGIIQSAGGTLFGSGTETAAESVGQSDYGV